MPVQITAATLPALTPSVEPIFTVGEAAEYLACSTRTICNLITSGKLKACKMGKSFRIRESAIADFLKAQEQDFSQSN